MVGSKQGFEVSLADVSQTQLQGKNDVILEFHVDDTTGANEVCGVYLMLYLLNGLGVPTNLMFMNTLLPTELLYSNLGFTSGPIKAVYLE